MAKISIQKQHSKHEKEIEALVEDLQSELGTRYGCSCYRNGDEIEIKRSGVTGMLKLYERHVNVDIVLSPMMGLLAGKIEPFIRKKLDEYLD